MSVEEARQRLVIFHNDYVRLLEARAAGNHAEATQIQMEMAHYSAAVHRDLDRVGMAYWTLIDAPASGGRRWPTPLADVVLTRLGQDYNVDPTEVRMVLRRAVGEYERMAAERWTVRLGRTLITVLLLPAVPIRAGWTLLTENLFALAALVGVVGGVLAILVALAKLF